MQSGHEGPAAHGQGSAKLPARADAELGEHLAQMPLDRARADEQLYGVLYSAPEELRQPLLGLTTKALVRRARRCGQGR